MQPLTVYGVLQTGTKIHPSVPALLGIMMRRILRNARFAIGSAPHARRKLICVSRAEETEQVLGAVVRSGSMTI